MGGGVITNIAFIVPGEPVGKGRPRIGKVGNHARMFTPVKTANYEGLIAHAGSHAMAGAAPFEEACAVELEIVLSVPASWSKKKQAAALAGQLLPTKKPDMDNTVKAIFDGMNGVVWRDDVQACRLTVGKVYGATPHVKVRVAVMGDAS